MRQYSVYSAVEFKSQCHTVCLYGFAKTNYVWLMHMPYHILYCTCVDACN